MRIPFVALVASAGLPLSAQIVLTDVEIRTSWRTSASGPADHVETHTSIADGAVLRGSFNSIMSEAAFWPGEFFNSIGPLAGYTGQFKQYTSLTFTVSAPVSVRFYGDLRSPDVQSGESQYAYVAELDQGITRIFIAGGEPFSNEVTGPLFYDTVINLQPGITYGYQVSTSWTNSNVFNSGFGQGGGAYSTAAMSYTPVPELSTYGLLLGGLALAGAALRRRRPKL